MSTPIFDPDDPRLTAYALGELPDAEREALEALLVTSPKARASVEETRTLSDRLQAEFAHENAAYQQANPPTTFATNVIPFPHPVRRWRPAVALVLKIAAVFLVLAVLTFAVTRRQPPTSVAMAPPPAAPMMKEAPAPPSVDQETPAASTMDRAAADQAAPVGMAKPEVPPPDPTTDRLAQASVRRARVAEAAPGAARPAPPVAAAAAPMMQPTAALEERLAPATVRVRLEDGSYVGGVVLTADGWIMATKKLSAIKNPGHATVVLADGREFAPSTTASMQNIGPGLFRIKAASLPTVKLAANAPAEGSELLVAHVNEQGGNTTYRHVPLGQTGGDALSGADFVFNTAGELLTIVEAPSMAKTASRAMAATIRDKAAVLTVRPFTAGERASLTHPPK